MLIYSVIMQLFPCFHCPLFALLFIFSSFFCWILYLFFFSFFVPNFLHLIFYSFLDSFFQTICSSFFLSLSSFLSSFHSSFIVYISFFLNSTQFFFLSILLSVHSLPLFLPAFSVILFFIHSLLLSYTLFAFHSYLQNSFIHASHIICQSKQLSILFSTFFSNIYCRISLERTQDIDILPHVTFHFTTTSLPSPFLSF